MVQLSFTRSMLVLGCAISNQRDQSKAQLNRYASISLCARRGLLKVQLCCATGFVEQRLSMGPQSVHLAAVTKAV